jgi:serine/threonine protein kinase
VIGKGTYSQVFRAKAISTGNIRAIKKIDKKKNPNIWAMLVNEFDILK